MLRIVIVAKEMGAMQMSPLGPCCDICIHCHHLKSLAHLSVLTRAACHLHSLSRSV